jgi:hypothetical protein
MEVPALLYVMFLKVTRLLFQQLLVVQQPLLVLSRYRIWMAAQSQNDIAILELNASTGAYISAISFWYNSC